MKTTHMITALVFALALQACDQQQQSSSPPPAAAPQATVSQVYTTTGEVTGVTADSVTISHQPVPALGWPAMNMTFRAPDSAMTAGLQTGAPVEFSFRQQGSDNVLTEIKRR